MARSALCWLPALLFTLAVSSSSSSPAGSDGPLDPDVGLRTGEIIRKHGYPVESHWVTTEDGCK